MKDYKNFDAVSAAKSLAHTLVSDAVAAAVQAGELTDAAMPEFSIEIPADPKNGDFSANAAMVGARAFRLAPQKIAQAIAGHISLDGTFFEKVEIAGPGFINFYLGAGYYADVITGVLQNGENYGRTDYGESKKVMVEFVSANPTGPMHLGNARGGALGDCLASCMQWAGYDVCREFYVNDAGNQIEKFGKSLAARYLQIFKGEDNVEFPEDGYQGEDIKVHAKAFADIHGDKYVNADFNELKKAITDYSLPLNIAGLKTDLAKYRIEYDNWFSEKTLHESGEVRRIIELLTEKGYTYTTDDGTVWYKASAFAKDGEEVKDEVLVRQNGIPTYFAADIAYHYNKFAVRGFDTCIDVWGADHHGHVARMKNAMNAIGLNGDKLDVVLMQLVRLVRDGEPVRMSKRTGKAITLTDLLDEIPIDSARFFFNLREPGSQMEFDLGLAVAEDSDNPVYYVQYAHARICSIIRKLAAEGVTPAQTADFSLLTDDAEKELIRHVACFPGEIINASKAYDPARITRYVITLATLFHKFYNACRVKTDNAALTDARLLLCVAVKTVIKNALTMLKITVPEAM